MRKFVLSLLLALIAIFAIAIPVWAISNPDSITFGSGSPLVFENVYETSDMLFIAEGNTNYAVEPADYTADKSFLFEILDTTGATVILSTPLASYGDRPIGIYQSAAQVTTNGLVSGTAYIVRIRGNPLIFSSSTNNTVSYPLGAGDYFDNTNVAGGFTPLRNFVINTIATNMQTTDGVTTYKTVILGITYLTTLGGNLFITGIPGLDTLEPSIFQASNQVLTNTATTGSGAYGASLTVQSVWGTATANGLAALSSFLGMGASNGGHILLWFLGVTIGITIAGKTRSPLVLLIILALTPLYGGLLGLMNLAAAFTISLILIIIGALFFSRNVLV